MNGKLNSFDWSGGDHAAFAFRDCELAVRLAREGPIAVDIETLGLGVESYTIKAFSLGNLDTAVVLDPDLDRQAIRAVLSYAPTLIFHNSPFDVPSLVGNGYMTLGQIAKVDDTLVSARLAHPGERVSKGLGDASEKYLGGNYKHWKQSLERGFRATTGKTKAQLFRELGLDSPAYVAYAAFDAIMTARLARVMPAAIRRRLTTEWFPAGDADYLLNREQTINRLLLRRSSVGIELDLDEVARMQGAMLDQAAICDGQLSAWGVDTSLSRELVKRDAVRVLDDLGAFPARYKRLANGTPSADQRHLGRLGHPIVELLQRRSQAERFAADYAGKCLELANRDGRIHPSVNILAATTGRMSIGDPPLQQFPAEVRSMLRFDGPTTSLDWSSIEPVFIGNACGELGLIEGFEAGGDLYLPVAEAAGVERKVAKVILLAQLYGQGAAELGAGLGLDEERTWQLIDRVMGRMPKVRKVCKEIKLAGNAIGMIQTVSGRVVPLDPDPRTPGKYFGYKGINYYVQGSTYDLLAEAIFTLDREGMGDYLELAVHDELLVATEIADEAERIMRTPPAAFVETAKRTPILRVGRSDLGTNWRPKA